MISVEYCQLEARYNRWMNERLYAAVRELSDEERKRDHESADAAILAWAGQLTPTWLAGTLEYRAASDGQQRQLRCWIGATHLFQHAVHHRGQVSTLLKQAGKDMGVTDIPFLPGVARTL